jgi:hypothetical protein
MDLYIVGEDDVTKTIIQKLLFYSSKNVKIISDLPARGGKIKSLVEKFNNLSEFNPVILLTDLDTYDCAPTLLNNWFIKNPRKPNFIVRIAIDEAEAWLMADREGFADYFRVPIDKIPTSKAVSKFRPSPIEMNFPYKSSLYMMKEIIPFTSNSTFKTKLIAKDGISKGPEYNTSIIPFIDAWNIQNASKNSSSLDRTVIRLKTFFK